jgi:hypothetical protein
MTAATHCIVLSNTCTLTNRLLLLTRLWHERAPPAAQECLPTDVLRKLTAGAGACRRLYSGLMLAARITLAHFSVSSATSFPNPVGVIGMGSPPSSVRRACSFGSTNTAFTA